MKASDLIERAGLNRIVLNWFEMAEELAKENNIGLGQAKRELAAAWLNEHKNRGSQTPFEKLLQSIIDT